jgi:molecular chaperone GrpE
MNIWKRKKMTEDNLETNNAEPTEEVTVTDKRRIKVDGEKVFVEPKDEATSKMTKSAEVLRLESELKIERERREAAEAKLVGVQTKFEELKTALERETAEMRERLRKSLTEQAKQKQFDFLMTLLPVLDNLNRAISAAESENASEGLLAGLRGTVNGFEAALANVGVEPVAAVGAKFNPELHEAVDTVEAEQDGIVTKEYSRGYRFGERLLRPARVQVGNAAVENAEAVG